MTTTLTIRLEKKQRDKLRSRARALGKTESATVREILDRELKSRRLGDVIGHLAGTFVPKGPEKPDAWRDHLRKQNWRT